MDIIKFSHVPPSAGLDAMLEEAAGATEVLFESWPLWEPLKMKVRATYKVIVIAFIYETLTSTDFMIFVQEQKLKL